MNSREPSALPDRTAVQTSRAHRMKLIRVAAAACAAFSVALAVAVSLAGSCRVLVALGSMRIDTTASGLAVGLSGTWEFDNLLQVSTGLSFNVLVVQGDRFVRFTYPDQAHSGYYTGLSQSLDNGLQGTQLQAIESIGTVDSFARIVSFEPQRMKLALVPLGATGPYSAVAYLVIDGDYVSPIISNTLSLSLDSTAMAPAGGAPAAAAAGAVPEAQQ